MKATFRRECWPSVVLSALLVTGCSSSVPLSGIIPDGGRPHGEGGSSHDATRPDSAKDGSTGADAHHDTAVHDAGADVGSGDAHDAAQLKDVALDDHDVNVPPTDASIAHPCSLPGSVQFTGSGRVTVDGGASSDPSLDFLTLPAGFCAHYFGTVPNARQLRFAPGGELFVASPSALTTGGNPSGALDAIVLLPDDNHNGRADQILTFEQFGGGSMTQGFLFTPGFFYFQDGTPPGTKIMRVPYAAGDRAPSGAAAQVADITVYTSGLHWPKSMDAADDGTIYVGNGGDQGEMCISPHPFHGGVLKIDPAPGGPNPNGVEVAQGLRNPINIKCLQGHNTCFGLELAKDYSNGAGGREKMFLIHQGDDWGFPCCATKGVPYTGSPTGTSCSGVTDETNSFIIGDTPFGLEFEPGKWPSMWAGRAYVVTHGNAGNWTGARMVSIPVDAATGLPTPSTDLTDADVGMVDFATGWDDGTQGHGRPSALAFSADGRLFVANDNNGMIFWVAPLSL